MFVSTTVECAQGTVLQAKEDEMSYILLRLSRTMRFLQNVRDSNGSTKYLSFYYNALNLHGALQWVAIFRRRYLKQQ